MYWRVFIASLCFCIYETDAASNASNKIEVTSDTNVRHKRVSYFDIIAEDLLGDDWKDHEKPCLNELVDIIGNVQNSTLWATWIWDSIQLPVGQLYGTKKHLGNYDQCLDLPSSEHPKFRTQYCLAEINLYAGEPEVKKMNQYRSIQDFVQSKTKHNLKYNSLTWGVCIPAICKPESITKFVKVLFRSTHLGQLESGVNISVDPEFCRVAGAPEDRSFGDTFVLSLFACSTVFTILCTWYVRLADVKTKSTGLDFAKAFDIRSNVESLMDAPKDCVGSVLGIRTISVFMTFMSHLNILKMAFGVSATGKYNKMLDTSMLSIFFNIEMVIDVFLMISAILWIKNLMHQGIRTFNPVKVIAKRYIRFMWPIILMLLILPQTFTPANPGPLARKYLKNERETCSRNWWKILLTIANYSDGDKMCYVPVWSVLCDLHICFVATIIYWIFVKNRRAGLQVFTIAALASVVLPIINAYKLNTPAIVKFDFGASEKYREFFFNDSAYSWSHNRAGPYFLGMAIGFLLSVFKPAKYKNYFSKKSSILAFSIFLFMFVSLNLVIYSYHWRESSALENAVFSVFRRVTWAALIGFLIIICEYGTLPLVTGFLSWSFWVPLSKLTYGIYLTHVAIMMRALSENRGPAKLDFFEDLILSFGYFVLSTIISFFMWIFLETPIINLIINNLIRKNETIDTPNRHAVAADLENTAPLLKKMK